MTKQRWQADGEDEGKWVREERRNSFAAKTKRPHENMRREYMVVFPERHNGNTAP